MDIGEVQAGVRVAADDHCFSPAAHGAAQGVAMGFGGVIFHAFGIARCKIGHGKTAVVGFAVETKYIMALMARTSALNCAFWLSVSRTDCKSIISSDLLHMPIAR